LSEDKTLDFDILTVEGSTLVTLGDSKFPRGTRRVIIEVSAPPNCGCSVPVRIIQVDKVFVNPVIGGARLAFDIQ